MGTQGLFCYVVFVAYTGFSLENPTSCDEVRKVFQMRQIGPVKSLPESPRKGSDLQVCMSKNLTCCTKKMEEKYQLAARRDLQNLLQTSSSSLKFLISRNVAAFQETFESLIKQAENFTNSLLLSTYRNMAGDASGPVQELFTDIGLFVLGSELSVEDFVDRFFDSLFPLVYNHLINPGLTDIALDYAECVRSGRREIRPFGSIPKQLAGQIRGSVLPGRVFLQALNLGIEVINTTDHLQYSKECKRALLKMQFCPHCQGLTRSKPCMGYCLNVMRGCLASMAEIDAHWREFIFSLEEVSNSMHGTYDLEQILLGVNTLVNDAITHAQRNGPRLSVQVHRLCGHPNRKPAQSVSTHQDSGRDSIPLRGSQRDTEETLTSRRKELINSLRLYRTFYGGLADHLCASELASADGLSCWNGADVVKSYTLRVVGNGIKAQADNPEVKVKEADPVINQIIDKLKHINQLLQGKSIPTFGTLDRIETGSGDKEGRFSGDCDDEDGCVGSGSGEVKKVLKVTKWTPDKVNDHRRFDPRTEESSETAGTSGTGSTAEAGPLTLSLICALAILLW
ncbi:glypican-5a isoform X1 [Megalops cyprinoides]|uniref:glypican-5a isoform X1 n=1 Tax=Megalops cyprinoides TaxID=118141 RepID=UPI001864AFC9|nr:glypican-5a isoform X1 [Megalops cyprinoides]